MWRLVLIAGAAAYNVQIGVQTGWPVVSQAAHAIEFYRNIDPVQTKSFKAQQDFYSIILVLAFCFHLISLH